MGIFAGARNSVRKAEATVVVKKLLQHQKRAGLFNLRPTAFAEDLVNAAWRQAPQVFDGTRGVTPHKVSIAAAALCSALDVLAKTRPEDPNTCAVAICLNHVLEDAEANRYLYGFNEIDHQILGSSTLTLREVMESLDGKFKSIDTIINATPSGAGKTTADDQAMSPEQAVMRKYGITFTDNQYWFHTYAYDKLNDAISYAKHVM